MMYAACDKDDETVVALYKAGADAALRMRK